MSYLINDRSSSTSHVYPILSSSSEKEEEIPDAMEETFIIPGLPDDAAYMIFNYATNGGRDNSMRLVNSIWQQAFDTVMLPRFWQNLKNRIQNNPFLRSIVQQVNSNVSLTQHKLFIKLFVDSVINSVLNPSFNEVDPSEQSSLSSAAKSIGPSYFSRFSLLTDELRKCGAPIPKERTALGFTHEPYEKMQQRLDSALETIWTQIQRQIDFEGAPVPENAQAIRAWLNDPSNSEKIADITILDLAGMGLKILPPEIDKFTQLRVLGLAFNELENLPESIGNLTQLTQLCLDNNKLTSLPESIGNLTQLTQFSLFTNRLTALPETIGNLTQLTQLYLSTNRLRSLPETIGNLTLLTHLYLADNLLRELPETIGKLTLLQQLILSQNLLVRLPKTIVYLTQLQELNLFKNHLVCLPETISSLSRLRSFTSFDNFLIFLLPKPLHGSRWDDGPAYPFLDHQKMVRQHSACSSYVCNSPLAVLCQEIHRGADRDVLQEAFGRLSEPMQQRIRQQWSAIPSSSSSSSEASDDLLTDLASFTKAVIEAIKDKWESLSEKQRNLTYQHDLELAERPLGEDPRWEETHLEDNIIRFIDAIEHVSQE